MIMRVEMTRHAREDRIDRLTKCMVEVGMNEIVREIKVFETDLRSDIIISITDTGLVFIKTTSGQLITGYMVTVENIVKIFRQVGERVPDALYKTVKRNCKRFPHLMYT